MRSAVLSLVIAFLATAFLSEQAAAQADYFQQTVDHQIAVALDDAEHTLRGDIATRYTNNSADTLDFLWIHLWPNAYKNGQTALAQQKFRQGEMFMFWALQRDLGGIDSLDFAVDGVAAEWSYHPEHIDIAKLTLPSRLRPGNRWNTQRLFGCNCRPAKSADWATLASPTRSPNGTPNLRSTIATAGMRCPT